MELLFAAFVGAFLATILITFVLNKKSDDSPAIKEHQELLQANQKIGDYENRIFEYVTKLNNLETELDTVRHEFEKLRHQKISADVKLGAKAENLIPFLSSFPYADDEIRGLFNPIDLVVFREDEVVFIEVKSGQSQLSEKQKRIKDNIKAGRVRFEVHRMDEKGVKIK